jgi:hypothetical protein
MAFRPINPGSARRASAMIARPSTKCKRSRASWRGFQSELDVNCLRHGAPKHPAIPRQAAVTSTRIFVLTFEQRCEKLAGSFGTRQRQHHRAFVGLNRDLKPEKAAACPLRVDDADDQFADSIGRANVNRCPSGNVSWRSARRRRSPNNPSRRVFSAAGLSVHATGRSFIRWPPRSTLHDCYLP